MLENVKPARLTKIGTLTISPNQMIADGFSGNNECSCRDVAVLVLVWAIGELQEELAKTLRSPSSKRKMVHD